MISIGLIGKMGSGKDTAADYLINTYGYVRVSFAAPLKELVIEADPLVTHWTHDNVMVPIHLSDVLEKMDFEAAKRQYPEVRRVLQRIGQGARRIDPDYWVRMALKEIRDREYDGVPVVVTDVRYLNEALALKARGFTLARIVRPAWVSGMTMADTRATLHESETTLDSYPTDVQIMNDSTMVDLADALNSLVRR